MLGAVQWGAAVLEAAAHGSTVILDPLIRGVTFHVLTSHGLAAFFIGAPLLQHWTAFLIQPLLFLGKLGATSVVIAILWAAALLLGAPQDMAGLGVP